MTAVNWYMYIMQFIMSWCTIHWTWFIQAMRTTLCSQCAKIIIISIQSVCIQLMIVMMMRIMKWKLLLKTIMIVVDDDNYDDMDYDDDNDDSEY